MNAVDFRKITTREFHHYVFKDGEYKNKNYEIVDWIKFPPLWIHNEVPEETLEMHRQYTDYLQEQSSRLQMVATADDPRENTIL